MTTAHVEKFAELVAKDPALLAKLSLDKVNADAAAAAASAAAILNNAVKEAKALGLEFTEEEFQSFMDAEARAAQSGEMTDTQLKAVDGAIKVAAPKINELIKNGYTGDKNPTAILKLGVDAHNATQPAERNSGDPEWNAANRH